MVLTKKVKKIKTKKQPKVKKVSREQELRNIIGQLFALRPELIGVLKSDINKLYQDFQKALNIDEQIIKSLVELTKKG